MSHPSWKQCDHSEEEVEEEDIKTSSSFNVERPLSHQSLEVVIAG
jgi:hypothetical protein